MDSTCSCVFCNLQRYAETLATIERIMNSLNERIDNIHDEVQECNSEISSLARHLGN